MTESARGLFVADWLHPLVGHRFLFIRVVQNLIIQWASLGAPNEWLDSYSIRWPV